MKVAFILLIGSGYLFSLYWGMKQNNLCFAHDYCGCNEEFFMQLGRRNMKNKLRKAIFALLIVPIISSILAAPDGAQTAEIKAKPPMYSYIAVWNIPKDQWEAKENQAKAAKNILDQAIAKGTIVSYGYDGNPLHDTFWLAMSKDGLESVREQFQKIGITRVPAKAGAPIPPVSVLISRYYNWRTIRCENAYVHVGIYKIKQGAPSDAADRLSKAYFAPVLEKMFADGAIFEWETDTYADPKDSPGTFLIAYLSAKGEDLEKANKAVQERLKSRLPKDPALDSLIDVKASSDVVVRSYAVYKK
jgi:hypothetical protein